MNSHKGISVASLRYSWVCGVSGVSYQPLVMQQRLSNQQQGKQELVSGVYGWMDRDVLGVGWCGVGMLGVVEAVCVCERRRLVRS